MKIIPPFFKQFLVVFTSNVIIITAADAQSKGVLPLTGMKFFNEGITAKALDVKIDGTSLMSNRIPLNKEIEISIQQPAGFLSKANNIMMAGAEVIILSPKGEILLKNPNALLGKYPNGFTVKDLNTFSIRFGIGNDIMKGNLNGVLKIRLYDMVGKGQMRLELPLTVARYGERLQVSKTAKTIKSADGINGKINGLTAKGMLVKVDTTIKVSPKMAYTSMDISSLEGTSLSGIFEGKENFWVYDSDLNEVKITDILLKQVKGALENNTVNYTLKIPYKLKANLAKLYTVRFRWESLDKSQLIDVVVTN